MKRILCVLPLLICHALLAQNVGVGETSPTHKLTVRTTDAFSRSLLLKTTANDTALIGLGFNHYLNGYTNTSSAALTVGNKHFIPFDNPQLTVMAWGERSGINANGSLSTIDFKNINNSSAQYTFSSYLGSANPNYMGLFYYNPADAGSKTLLYFTQAGLTGIGTFQPLGRLQVNHTSTIASPTLNLYDSSAGGGPIIQFRNAGGSKTWQIRSNIDHTGPGNDELDFYNNNTLLARLSNNGSFNMTGNIAATGNITATGNMVATGTITASEVQRPSTGASNMVPIAYANVSSAGFVQHSSGNVTVSKLGPGFYQVTITGESYQFQSYATVVTPAGNTAPIMINTGSGSGNLHIYTYHFSGVLQDSQFCFVVYKQ